MAFQRRLPCRMSASFPPTFWETNLITLGWCLLVHSMTLSWRGKNPFLSVLPFLALSQKYQLTSTVQAPVFTRGTNTGSHLLTNDFLAALLVKVRIRRYLRSPLSISTAGKATGLELLWCQLVWPNGPPGPRRPAPTLPGWGRVTQASSHPAGLG
jgi:hypothetical protein